MTGRLDVAAIERAAAEIDPVFRDSPQLVADVLSGELDFELVVKVETLNPIRSFKGRATDTYVRRLDDDGAPLVCASAGNFGQGLAYAGTRAGRAVRVFAAATANSLKLARIRELGAEVEVGGADFDAAKEGARAHADATGARYVEDGREPAIAEGNGTIAVELGRRVAPLDAIIVPVGNGALIEGVGAWLAATAPATRVIGVCASGAPAMERSWRSGTLVTTDRVETIADGMGVRVPVPEALDGIRGLVHEMVLVEDARILEAMRRVHETLGLVVEPAGAAGVAAAIDLAAELRGSRVGTILCGGNVPPERYGDWLTSRS